MTYATYSCFPVSEPKPNNATIIYNDVTSIWRMWSSSSSKAIVHAPLDLKCNRHLWDHPVTGAYNGKFVSLKSNRKRMSCCELNTATKQWMTLSVNAFNGLYCPSIVELNECRAWDVEGLFMHKQWDIQFMSFLDWCRKFIMFIL